MGNGVTVGERPAILDSLFDVIAAHKKVDPASLTLSTRFGEDLATDEHDLEEIRINYEESREILIHHTFDDAKTIADLFDIVAKYS
jgi:hypothetical protein